VEKVFPNTFPYLCMQEEKQKLIPNRCFVQIQTRKHFVKQHYCNNISLFDEAVRPLEKPLNSPLGNIWRLTGQYNYQDCYRLKTMSTNSVFFFFLQNVMVLKIIDILVQHHFCAFPPLC